VLRWYFVILRKITIYSIDNFFSIQTHERRITNVWWSFSSQTQAHSFCNGLTSIPNHIRTFSIVFIHRRLFEISTNLFFTVIMLFKNPCSHTTHAPSPKGKKRHLRYSSETLTFYQNYLAMRNTADVTGGKPIAVWSQSIRTPHGTHSHIVKITDAS
jgi:hypothetical protein